MHLPTIIAVLGLCICTTLALPHRVGLDASTNHLTLIPREPLSKRPMRHIDVQEEYPQHTTQCEPFVTIYATRTLIVTAPSTTETSFTTTQTGFSTATRAYPSAEETPVPTPTNVPCQCTPVNPIKLSWLQRLRMSQKGRWLINWFLFGLTAPGCLFVLYHLVMGTWGSLYGRYRRWQGYEAAAREAMVSVGESASLRVRGPRERGVLLGIDEETGLGTGRWEENYGSVRRERSASEGTTDNAGRSDEPPNSGSWRQGRPVRGASIV
ncbi:hypothetical protein EDC01DRAFT_729821 [Geopyxis carbonaria]|nr:hypothetical protein EDC01DRAFT_729821 [Geopyxis carbonaria]